MKGAQPLRYPMCIPDSSLVAVAKCCIFSAYCLMRGGEFKCKESTLHATDFNRAPTGCFRAHYARGNLFVIVAN